MYGHAKRGGVMPTAELTRRINLTPLEGLSDCALTLVSNSKELTLHVHLTGAEGQRKFTMDLKPKISQIVAASTIQS